MIVQPQTRYFSEVEAETKPESNETQIHPEEIYKNIIQYADNYLVCQFIEEKDHVELGEMVKPHVAAKLLTQPISPVG